MRPLERHHLLRDLARNLSRWLRKNRRAEGSQPGEPESPEDPYAYVGAPKKPRLPGRSAAAAASLE